ncbi:30S ribosomal protein S8 [Rickettsiella grylli]|nr:30S ribosomal protein S8 [Rickettsiella grylli]OIZ99639.1 30S ribosomal protein S8 [Rickettsiella grylli]
MTMQDPIADMFCRIKNAQAVVKPTVSMPSSKIKLAIAKLLKEEGYINDYQCEAQNSRSSLTLFLKYYLNKPVVAKLKRISRPGLRIYRAANELPKVVAGLGIAIVSTPKGLMTDRAARAIGQGGEVIAIVE